MWKNKKISSAKAGAAVLLTACLLAGNVPTSANDTSYQTATVTRGTMVVEAKVQIEYEYVKKEPIVFNSAYGSSVFMGYVAEPGSYVSEGEPIANIATNVDEIVLEETKLRLQRAQRSREKAYASMQEQLETAERAVEESYGTQKQIAQLRLEQLLMEQERNKRLLDEEVDGIQKELDAYEDAVGVTQIFAPASGRLINSLRSSAVGTQLWNGAQIGVIESDVEPIFSMKDLYGVMRYGLRVIIQDTDGNEYPARVVSCGSKYLSSDFETTKAYIKADKIMSWKIDAVYENIHIDNVLLVDTAAVQLDENGTYVVELKDGELSKCYFKVAKTVNDLCYAIDGLTDGMTVIIR